VKWEKVSITKKEAQKCMTFDVARSPQFTPHVDTPHTFSWGRPIKFFFSLLAAISVADDVKLKTKTFKLD
jgi:hypothetical protein